MKIYIVKFMSTGKSESKYHKYSKKYNKFAIIDTGGNIDDIIEGYRQEQQKALQEANAACEVITTVSSKEVISVQQVLVSK